MKALNNLKEFHNSNYSKTIKLSHIFRVEQLIIPTPQLFLFFRAIDKILIFN